MKPFAKLFLWASISLATLTITTGCSKEPGIDTGNPVTSSGGASVVTSGPSRISQGTQGDSLEACLARIPSDASAGQRMVAERTCQRDAENRSSIDAVPGQ